MQIRSGPQRFDTGIPSEIVGSIQAVEMYRRRHHLVALQALEPAHATLAHRSQARAGFAQAPIQQLVLAAAHDRRRLRDQHAGRTREAREHPEIEFVAREEPLPGHLGTGDRAGGDEFVELAFAEPKIVGGFAGRQEFHPAFLCKFLLLFDVRRRWNSAFQFSSSGTMPDHLAALQHILTRVFCFGE
ncbi:hypothetical protein AB7M75_000662 [Bradyrhizobium ottawaense]